MIREFIAGVGLRRGCSMRDIVNVIQTASAAVGHRVSVLAAPSFKRQEPGLAAASRMLDIELVFIDDRALHLAQPHCVTHSALAERAVGFASVAEASALAAAGPRGRLLLPRIRGHGATCAIAERH